MKKDSIIFDLDGTLWNSITGVLGTWNEVLKSYPEVNKVITKEELESCMGMKIYDIAAKLFPNESKEMQMKLMDECSRLECEYLSKHGGKLFDGLEETLKKLSKDYKLLIVSNCQSGYIESFFEAHKLKKYFIDYECLGKTKLSKGENIKLVIERNNLKSAVYVGDTILDAEATKVANIPFIFADYGFGQVEEYDKIIHNFPDLINVMKEY